MTNKFIHRLTPLAAALLLGACSLMPTYERPAAPMANQWPLNSADSANTKPANALAWQDFFADASLRHLIEIALANNRDLRVAVLNIEQARAQLGIKRADQFPTVSAALTGSRTPNGTYLATAQGSQSARISLIATVAQTWLSLLADEELLALSQQTLATRDASLTLVQLRFDNGASSELELRQAQSLKAAAQVTLAQQQRQRALDENALVLLLGQALPPDVRTALATARLTALRLPELPIGLPSDLLSRRPDIQQAEQQLIAANANIGAARAAFFPRISLTSGVGSGSNELAGLFKDGTWGFTMAPQLLLPVFDAGRNQAGLDSAKAGRDIATAQYEKTIQTAFREVADALAGRDTLTEQLRAQQVQTDAETQRLRLTDLRLKNGAANLLESLDAQRALFGAQQALVQTRLAYLQNQVVLYKTLGGGPTLSQP